MSVTALRGAAITFRDDPFQASPGDCLVHEPDALILIEDGRITAFGPYADLRESLPEGTLVTEYKDAIISAGFVDTHVHYPQLPMIGAYGEQLLEWLEKYVFPVEAKFADPEHAAQVAAVFLRELLRAGTTTAAVYCTVHPQSVEAFFTESARFDTRMVAGKVLMDRHAPEVLRDTAQQGYDESAALIARWHGRGRQHYCVTPRFAPTSTEAQLEAAGALLKTAHNLFMQTHIAENRAECAWVEALFPERSNYLDVYAHAGLIGHRSVLGHGIHLAEQDFCTCHATGAALAHCPTSNLFLGSGLFRLFDAMDPRRPVRVGLGTDVGAGTSLSQLASLNEAYKVAQLTGRRLSALQSFWLATLGGARALYLDDRIGRIAPDYEADLCVLDLKATPLMRFRMPFCESLEDQLFVLMTLGDDRVVRATYAAGHKVYDRDQGCFIYAGRHDPC
ncbi:guanine deaminase [Lichenifustis flavocetrariae]|uniref:Guanine deaminase n=1 Tax=Lichenifustis flavocetrariae TaxID=2949735 RepID=A0AA41Z4D0_9HYPH|nr:guanine deaminase [Lichenifustis flavocetrariae]MCW6509027.1 guanine deaminase [Lichenifustis flavocetrariae]